MKIIELEIFKIRGIQYLKLNPNALNFCIWGPNGSGKSAVVDAIDFLLTGNIFRLTGEGTKTISLSKHGPHLGSSPEQARVNALVKIDSISNPILISRCMAEPNKLVFEEKYSEEITNLIESAKMGHHVLTRREILQYVNSEGNKRAQRIQTLLNISNIETIRKSLKTLSNDFEKDRQSAGTILTRTEMTICSTLGIKPFSEKTVLQKVNDYRAIFNGSPITNINSTEVQKDVSQPHSVDGTQKVNVTFIKRDIEKLILFTEIENLKKVSEVDDRLRLNIGNINRDPRVFQALKLHDFIEKGVELIDETGACPLCETIWPDGELIQHLRERLELGERIQQTRNEVLEDAKQLTEIIHSVFSSLENLITNVRVISDNLSIEPLMKWQNELTRLRAKLENPIEDYFFDVDSTESGKFFGVFEGLVDILNDLQKRVIEKFPMISPEQTAWDTLTTLGANLLSYQQAKQEMVKCKTQAEYALKIYKSFVYATDSTINSIYKDIKSRFVELYRYLHGEDEAQFDATLESEGPALNFEVDFYGHGKHPPSAMHSEGHQDSMGLCLFLALSEKLTSDQIQLVVLDDVVMSVDAGHRRRLCDLLSTKFPNRQFFITTHDQTWSKQLRYSQLIPLKNMTEFYNWSLITGPYVLEQKMDWEKIDQDLEKNDVPAAAARLRRSSEEFFSSVCSLLNAKVVYKENNSWDLGELMSPAKSRFDELLCLASKVATSWGQQEQKLIIDKIINNAGMAFSALDIEQWAVNANVHYNNWANFTLDDFKPVVTAFKNVFEIFKCKKCDSFYYLVKKGLEVDCLRCNCAETNLNLVKRKGVTGTQ